MPDGCYWPGLCVETQRQMQAFTFQTLCSAHVTRVRWVRKGHGKQSVQENTAEWTEQVMASLTGARKFGFDPKVQPLKTLEWGRT